MSSTTTLLFVLGMHRSGTSALCAALAACGASFGDQLIDAMAGVNDEGFWEDAGVVDINEQLLAQCDASWYAPGPELLAADWSAAACAPLRERGAAILRRGFGDGPLQAVKDPRLCLTLPFWLSLCSELGIPARVCITSRAPLEVAASLERRDGFPPGYGLRLYSAYREGIERFAPETSLQVRYNDLLDDSPAVMKRFAEQLPLAPVDAELKQAVRSELRHQAVGPGDDLLAQADDGSIDMERLRREIDTRYPVDETLRDFARRLTGRGLELDQIGSAHTAALATLDERDADIEALSAEHRKALATVDERDADIEGLSAEHRQALATIAERDEQIREFDRRLSTLGEEHSHALEVLRQRDAELAWIKQRMDAISKVPGVGYLIKRLRQHAQG